MSWILKPAHSRACMPQLLLKPLPCNKEAAAVSGLHAATGEKPLLTANRESLYAAMKTLNSQKQVSKTEIKKFFKITFNLMTPKFWESLSSLLCPSSELLYLTVYAASPLGHQICIPNITHPNINSWSPPSMIFISSFPSISATFFQILQPKTLKDLGYVIQKYSLFYYVPVDSEVKINPAQIFLPLLLTATIMIHDTINIIFSMYYWHVFWILFYIIS